MKTNRVPWQTRLAPRSKFHTKCPKAGSDSAELTLTFVSDSGYEYELDCTVWVEYEPAQHGGRLDPSWSAHYHSAVAYWYRPNHGWKEIDLTSRQEDEIIDHFGNSADDFYGRDPDDYYDSRFDRKESRYW